MSGPYSVGDFQLWRLIEWEGPTIPLKDMFGITSDEPIDAAREWLEPHFLRPDGVMLIGTQSFIVRTPQHTILIDACVGNDKPRAAEHFNRMHTPYLENMAKLGFTPPDFDMVIITHFHIDHVGWCTRLVDDQWVPTFPNARHIFVQEEWEYWKQFPSEDHDSQECIRDSVIPVIDAGKADGVDANAQIAEGIWLEAIPGHTPGHAAVHLSSAGQDMIIAGDLMHHPIQIAEPEWSVPHFDVDRNRAIQTRKTFLDRYKGTSVVITCTHFTSPAFGHLVQRDERLRFEGVS
jgi:glyoxylase-like metal-dependent hydrolase (beta-lactamase superfamily II)